MSQSPPEAPRHVTDSRILTILLFNTAHRWIGEAAGTELLARLLAERGHRVVMAIPRRGGVEAHFPPGADSPFAVERIPWRLPERKGDGTAAQYRAVAALLRRLRPDIIHVGRGKEHWCTALLRPIASPRSRIVRTRHVVLPIRQHVGNRLLMKWGTDAVTAVSSAAFAGLGALGDHLPPERRRVVLGAVDVTRYSPARRSEELRAQLGAGGEGTLLVGCLGRWQRIKGQDVFLEAMGRVLERHPHVRGVMAGRHVTIEHPRVQRMHEEFGLEGRMAYRGLIEQPERLIASLDIGVIASRGSEGFSRIAVEYFASGVPVVATRVGALPEIIRDGETGLLVDKDDPSAMAEAIGRLVEDAGLRRRLAEFAAHDAATRFAPERMVAEIEAVYRAAL